MPKGLGAEGEQPRANPGGAGGALSSWSGRRLIASARNPCVGGITVEGGKSKTSQNQEARRCLAHRRTKGGVKTY